MHLTPCLNLRRIYNYSFHPFRVIPKPSNWFRRERLGRFVAWQYGTHRCQLYAANKKLNKTLIYMDMQRKDKPKLEIHYANERLQSALAEHHADFANFKNMLDRAHILIDKRTLSTLALYEPLTFKALVELTQKMAFHAGIPIYPTEAELEHVEVDSSLLAEPFPRANIFRKGPSENHKRPPRLLKRTEY